MARKLLVVLAALLIPGALLALVAAVAMTRLARTEEGRSFLERLRRWENPFRRGSKRLPAVAPESASPSG